MIGKFLDICTSHLTQETVDNIVMENIPYVHSYNYEEGMFIVVPDTFEEQPHPDDLDKLFKYARQNDVILIRLDRDAEEIDELPTYEW